MCIAVVEFITNAQERISWFFLLLSCRTSQREVEKGLKGLLLGLVF